MFEYSKKSLPHALVHQPEQVIVGGHCAAYDTCVPEADHKDSIKKASKYARVYASRNETQEHMLQWTLWRRLWQSVIKRSSAGSQQLSDPDPSPVGENKLGYLIPCTERWSDTLRTFTTARDYYNWAGTFLSKRVLITREELLTMLCHELQIEPARQTRQNNIRLATQLTWEFYGTLSITNFRPEKSTRKFVGIERASVRRDFVRLRGVANNTALSAQVDRQSMWHVCVFLWTYVWCKVTHVRLRVTS